VRRVTKSAASQKSAASEKSEASGKYEASDNKARRVDPGVVALICHHTFDCNVCGRL